MDIFKKKGFLFIALLGLIAPNWGCSKKSQKVSLGYVSSGLTGLAVQVMKDNKIPEKHGIEINYLGFPNPSASNNAFIMGKYDVNLAAGVNVIALSRSKGYKFQYFFPTLLNSVSLIVKKDSQYKNLYDLKGEKIGWYGLASGGGTAFYVLGERKKINILSDFKLIQSNPPVLWPFLERGEVEAIIIFEPFVSRILATGNYRVILGPFYKEWQKETGFRMEMAGFAAKEDWLSDNLDLAKKMIRIWKETVDSIKKHKIEIINKYSEFTNLKSEQEIELASEIIPQIYVHEWGTLDQSIELMLHILAKDGVLISQVPEGTIRRIK